MLIDRMTSKMIHTYVRRLAKRNLESIDIVV